MLISGFGPKATELAARIGDGYVNVSPAKELVDLYRSSGGTGVTQAGAKVCWAPDKRQADETVHRLWRHQAVPGEVAQVLPSPQHFEQIGEIVTVEQAAGIAAATGPDVAAYVEGLQAYVDAGFDEVYISQIGEDQQGFLEFWQRELRSALREATAR